jgi:hypothetical protein
MLLPMSKVVVQSIIAGSLGVLLRFARNIMRKDSGKG